MPYQIEARFSYWFLQKEILWAYAFVGSGFGMIQPAITIGDASFFEDTGFNNISVGGGLLLRFGKTVGLNFQVDFDQMFPSSYTNLDFGAGLQLTF